MKAPSIKTNQKFSVANFIGLSALVILIVVIGVINNRFFLPQNITDMLVSLSTLLVLGCGMTSVLLTGAIDLSIGAIYASCSVLLTLMMSDGMGAFSFVLAILFGIGAGALNGILYTKLRIPSFITTLGTMNIWQSFALLVSGSVPLQVKPDNYWMIDFAKINLGVIPLLFVIALAVFVVAYLIQKYTKFGRYTFAVGANERSARLAGVNVDKVKITTMLFAGLCAAIAGIMITAKLKSGIPTVGDAVTLQVIAACALGGTALAGGKGNILFALLGCAIVVVINNGMNMVGVDMTMQQVVFGSLVIAAVCLTADRSRKEQIIK